MPSVPSGVGGNQPTLAAASKSAAGVFGQSLPAFAAGPGPSANGRPITVVGSSIGAPNAHGFGT